jgi:hypothetical protein
LKEIVSLESHQISPKNILERIRIGLPQSTITNFYSHLDASIHFFSAALIIDAQLDDITILERERQGFDVGW